MYAVQTYMQNVHKYTKTKKTKFSKKTQSDQNPRQGHEWQDWLDIHWTNHQMIIARKIIGGDIKIQHPLNANQIDSEISGTSEHK